MRARRNVMRVNSTCCQARITFKYVLADSWFACESLIHAVRELCNGAVHLSDWIGLEEVRPLLEVLSQEAGIDLLECLSTVAAQQTADFSTKEWAHLLCDSDDLAMPDLS